MSNFSPSSETDPSKKTDKGQEATSKNGNQVPVPEQSKDGVDALAERIGESEGVSDDIARSIAENWRNVVGVIVVVLLFAWIINGYKTAQRQKLEDSSLQLSSAQQLFSLLQAESNLESKDTESSELEGGPDNNDQLIVAQTDDSENSEKLPSLDELIENRQRAFNDTLKTVASASGTAAYSDLAELYLARMELEKSEITVARSRLKKFAIEPLFKQTSTPVVATKINSEQILNELAAMLFAKSFLIKKEDAAKAREYLLALCKNSQLVTTEVLVSLLRISPAGEQRAEIISVARKLAETRPKLADKIEQELTIRGIRLRDN